MRRRFLQHFGQFNKDVQWRQRSPGLIKGDCLLKRLNLLPQLFLSQSTFDPCQFNFLAQFTRIHICYVKKRIRKELTPTYIKCMFCLALSHSQGGSDSSLVNAIGSLELKNGGPSPLSPREPIALCLSAFTQGAHFCSRPRLYSGGLP